MLDIVDRSLTLKGLKLLYDANIAVAGRQVKRRNNVEYRHRHAKNI